jgi:hypothetical protein
LIEKQNFYLCLLEVPTLKIAIVATDNPKLEGIGGKHVHQNLLEKALLKLGHEVGVFFPVPIWRLNVAGKLKVALWSIHQRHLNS